MEQKHEVTIKVDKHCPTMSSVKIDGMEIGDCVSGVKFIHEAGKLAKMQLELVNCNMKIVSPFLPDLPEQLKGFYVKKTIQKEEDKLQNMEAITEELANNLGEVCEAMYKKLIAATKSKAKDKKN